MLDIMGREEDDLVRLTSGVLNSTVTHNTFLRAHNKYQRDTGKISRSH